jgi:hypothetical protein
MYRTYQWKASAPDSSTATLQKREASLASLVREVDEMNAWGLRNMPWKPATDSAASLRVVDVNWLVQQPDLPFLVQALPAQILHRSLVAHGLDDALEVIEWIRGQQLVRFMDYELWDENAELGAEDISCERLIPWMRRWLEISPSFAAERVSELEEESMILIFSKLLDIQVEGISKFDIDHHDDYWTTVDGRYHLRVKDADPATFEVAKQVVDSLYGLDIKWASSILAHASMLVRDEALEMAQKWREGRLADAGFVPREESLSVLRPRKFETLKADVSKAIAMEIARRNFRDKMAEKAKSIDEEMDDEASVAQIEEMKDSVRGLLRRMEPELAVRAIETSLGVEGVQQLTDGAKFDADFFVEDEEIMEEAVASVVARTRLLLLKVDAAEERRFREHRLLLERVFAHVSEENPEECGELKTRLARVVNMFLSASSRSPDADAQERAVSVVRGCINLGLEFCLKSPQDFSLSFEDKSSFYSDHMKGAEALRLVGPEYLFQLGWSSLHEICRTCADAFEKRLPESLERPSQPLSALLQAQRFAEVRKWISAIEPKVSAPVFHVVSSLVNRVPLYPEILSVEGHALSASASRRSFETFADVEKARAFVSNMPSLDVMG